MILFFPQYQAGYMPSSIPVGTPSLRKLWAADPDFAEVPLQPSDPAHRETDRGILASLDRRLATKAYGKTLLAALPDAPRVATLEALRDAWNGLAAREVHASDPRG